MIPMKCIKRQVVTSQILLLMFSVILLLHTGINSDVLYPFSFSKDLLGHISIKNWAFPGPLFFFPDILVSLPIIAIVKTPQLWVIVFGYLQILAMVLLIAHFSKKNNSVRVCFIHVTYLTIIVYVFGAMLFHDPWTTLADKAVIPAHHFSSALLAMFVFFVTPVTDYFNKTKIVCLLILGLIIGFSDPLFILFLGGLYFPYLLQHHVKLFQLTHWISVVCMFFISTFIGIFLNLHFNSGFGIEWQAGCKFHILENFICFKKVMGWYGINVLFTLPIITLFIGYKVKNILVIHLSTSMIVIALIAIVFGLLKDDMSLLRYMSIDFPLIIYCVYALMSAAYLEWTLSWVTSLLMLIFGLYYAYHYFQHYRMRFFPENLQSILACENLNQHISGSVFVSTYWPAKLVFEYTDRTASLVQIGEQLQLYNWINNLAWQKQVHQPKSALISTIALNPNLIDQLKMLPKAQTMCNGQLIRVPFQAELYTLIPTLKQYQK